MARRDRQRRRRAANPGPKPSEPHRDNVPGSADHVSGEVDQFEAQMIAGAGGAPDPLAAPDAETEVDADPGAEVSREDEAALAPLPGDVGARGDEDEEDGAPVAARGAGRHTAHVPAGHGGGFRGIAFLRASWAELQRVQWPDRRQVGQATAVVLGFVVIAGAYLGLADLVAQRVIDFIL